MQLLIWKTAEHDRHNARRSGRPWEERMIITDDATPVELRHAEESPHASDDEIERLFVVAAKDNEEFIRQITEWVFQ